MNPAFPEGLEENESRLRLFFDKTHDGISLIDEEGICLEWNESQEKITGICKEEALGRYAWDLMYSLLPRDRRTEKRKETLERTFQDSLRTGIPAFKDREIFEGERPDGTRILIKLKAFPLKTEKGYCIGFISQDVTGKQGTAGIPGRDEGCFRGIIERSSDLIFILDKDLSPLYVSPSSRSMTGYDPEELINKPPEFAHSTLFSQSGPELTDAARRTMNGEVVENIGIWISSKDGSRIFVILNAVPVVHEGMVTAVQVSMRDSTALKRVELALKESEEKFRSIVENSNDIWYSLTCDGTITYMSPKVTDLLGYKVGEIVGKEGSLFIHPDDYPSQRKMFFHALATGEKVRGIELRIRHKNGEWMWHSQSVSPIFDGKGNLLRIQGISRDITEAKTAEESLRRSEEKFRSFVENADDIVFSLKPDGTLTYVSPKWTELTGYDSRDIISHPVQYIHSEDLPRVRESFRKIFQTGKKEGGIECRLHHTNGTWIWFTLSISPIRDSDGNIVACIGISHDITGRKKNEEAFRRANRQLKLLSSITRHDILNRISVIQGYITIAEQDCADSILSGYLGKMNAAIQEIQSQIEFTRMYHNLGSHEPRWIRMADIMPGLPVPETITLKADLENISVFADTMFEKVFFNLLDNSVRHGKQVTEIHVSAHHAGDHMAVVWEDNGGGFPAENKERIFELGYGMNTGYGMFLVREVLSLTGLSIKETGIFGKSARFEITVPEGTYRTAG
jgi:PAS domain S-box-containing protein